MPLAHPMPFQSSLSAAMPGKRILIKTRRVTSCTDADTHTHTHSHTHTHTHTGLKCVLMQHNWLQKGCAPERLAFRDAFRGDNAFPSGRFLWRRRIARAGTAPFGWWTSRGHCHWHVMQTYLIQQLTTTLTIRMMINIHIFCRRYCPKRYDTGSSHGKLYLMPVLMQSIWCETDYITWMWWGVGLRISFHPIRHTHDQLSTNQTRAYSAFSQSDTAFACSAFSQSDQTRACSAFNQSETRIFSFQPIRHAHVQLSANQRHAYSAFSQSDTSKFSIHPIRPMPMCSVCIDPRVKSHTLAQKVPASAQPNEHFIVTQHNAQICITIALYCNPA